MPNPRLDSQQLKTIADRQIRQDQLLHDFLESLGLSAVYHEGRKKFVFKSRRRDPDRIRSHPFGRDPTDEGRDNPHDQGARKPDEIGCSHARVRESRRDTRPDRGA